MMRRRLPGFSLVELTVGASIFSIIMGAAFFLLIRYGQVAARGEAISEALNWGRTAIGKINEDVRQARYLYHYTQVSFQAGLKVDGISIQQGLPGLALTYPIVTAGPFIGGPVPGYTDTAGVGYLLTDSLTMMGGTLAEPKYMCWLRHPGPADPVAPTVTELGYKKLWYRLIRVEMKCGEFTSATVQGKWLDMSQKWPTFGAHPASRSTLVFADRDQLFGGQTCSASTIQVFGYAANPGIFRWVDKHPYSAEGPMSPYWVEVSLQMGNPFNNQLRTGKSGGYMIANDWYIQSVALTSAAYAQNVTMPGAL